MASWLDSPRILKAQRMALRIRKTVIDWMGWSGQTYFVHRVGEYREMWRSAAAELGGSLTPLAADLWEVRVGSARTRMHNHQAEFDNPVILGLAGKKAAVHRLLAADGLPVPDYKIFTLTELDAAYAFLAQHPEGCVVKPANGYGGQGVTTHLQQPREVRRAAILASLYDYELLIEAQIPGESCRLLILEGRMVHAVRRRGPRLVGDGRTTVRDLIVRDNAARRAAHRHELDLDRDCLFTLEYQGLTLTSTPEAGREFLVKSVDDPARRFTEVRTVYTETITDLVCDAVRRDAERAAALVESDFLGVDIITRDPGVPLPQSGGIINEVNTTPALHHHYEDGQTSHPAAAVQVLRAVLGRKASGARRGPMESATRG